MSYHGSGRHNGAIRNRNAMRMEHIWESQRILLEMVTMEPILQQCFKVVESTCLAQGIHCTIGGGALTSEFKDHVDEYYLPFCKDAIRAFFTYGFAPWRVRKVSKGNEVPEIIPPGMFDWFTEVGPTEKRGGYSQNEGGSGNKENSRLVVYRIRPTQGAFKEEDVQIYCYQTPALDVSTQSILHATVPSPLGHVLTDYKNLRQAQIRRSHADAWNTTAKIIATFDPKLRTEDNPSQYLMDFVHEDYYAPPEMGNSIFPPFEAHNVWQREHIIRKQFQNNPSTHMPDVYALPRDHAVSTQHMLTPCEDLEFLLEKYRRDVSGIMGVPYEMISGRGAGGHETVKKTMASGRLFSCAMHEICRHLQNLLKQVYKHIYGKNDVEWLLVPMPRLEIESVADFKVLYEIGALTPDMSLKLSRVLVGDNVLMSKRQTQQTRPQMAGGEDAKRRKIGNEEEGRKSDENDDEQNKTKPRKPPAQKT